MSVAAIIFSETRHSADEADQLRIKEALRAARVVDVVVSRNEGRGELSSIVSALETLDQIELHGLLLIPSGQKRISQSIVAALLHRFWTSHAAIVAAEYDGKRGFPVVISESLFGGLRRQPPGTSLKSFIEGQKSDTQLLAFDKQDNTPAQLQAIVSPTFPPDDDA
jgi:CTP:molybdopterin cytidylyltransferase MocA